MKALQNWTITLCCALFVNAACALPAKNIGKQAISDSSVPTSRKWIAYTGTAVVLGGSLALYMQSSNHKYDPKFHIRKSGADWIGLDKALHGTVSYTTANLMYGALRWAGTPEKNAAWIAAGSSMIFITIKEYLDGHDQRWGWSWSDAGANLAGAALFGAQQLAWGEQRLQLKFSAVPRRYTGQDIERRASSLFGHGLERAVKDYNQHTYWLSVNLHSMGWQKIPAWISLAIGTGAENLYGPKQNLQTARNGTIIFDRRNLPRRRQWYLSPDIDLTKIPANSKFLRTAFYVLNTFKFPLPAVELTGGKVKVKAIAF